MASKSTCSKLSRAKLANIAKIQGISTVKPGISKPWIYKSKRELCNELKTDVNFFVVKSCPPGKALNRRTNRCFKVRPGRPLGAKQRGARRRISPSPLRANTLQSVSRGTQKERKVVVALEKSHGEDQQNAKFIKNIRKGGGLNDYLIVRAGYDPAKISESLRYKILFGK